jgi:hypothetical protein
LLLAIKPNAIKLAWIAETKQLKDFEGELTLGTKNSKGLYLLVQPFVGYLS